MEKEIPKVIQDRYKKLQQIKEQGINPYPYSYNQKNHTSEILKEYATLKNEEHSGKKVSVAGRIMSLRRMGKASFANLQDETGKIQFYIRQDAVGEESYKLFKLLDIGDIIGIKGEVFKTRTGEITISVESLALLTKTLYPLPEKYHGVADSELKYRRRYLDLIMSPEKKETFIKRTKIINAVREFLTAKGFLEVDTPILQPIYGGANARPFKTHLNALNMDIYLRISNELYLKRLIVAGYEKVFEFAKDFRNEGVDKTHNPEFMQVECYQAYVDYNEVMKLTEDLWVHVMEKVLGTTKIVYEDKKIDFSKPWKRIKMVDAIKECAGINVDETDDETLLAFIKDKGIEINDKLTRGLMIQAIFEEMCEPHMIQPTFVIDHPKETTPLCKPHRKEEEFVERFELFVAGMELANAYSELNNPILQRELLEEQAKELRAGSEEAHPMDEDFIRAIEYGMPPTGGLGIGIDRMVMLLTGQTSIRDVIFFPFMKVINPENKERDKEKAL